ncbi:hypothetical protein F4V57_01285 [Acinetobacter qingfengensis]|uniref:MaoC-like domain-containing protein n=1 Tax=Acinetobacter qingfengensis TaxID=1262585 RepID=A0A1E7R9D6_9GAMM|nr:MaoC/PaaZ C-terminal domain-containing protein [Acinetobacter qingfengensis]KAA8735463.1 hypothetical protein F4V57_01285 [Acinetobacter qingfengensis]OEY95892.1 hypothetical protein BJI46_02965 [Acinetobacter qingfengensis]
MKMRHFSQLPKAYMAYPKVLQGLIQKPQTSSPSLPQVEYIVDHLQIDSVHLAKYKKICHYFSDGYVPATYLAVLSQSLQMHMMTQEDFPFPILGLVHLRNQVKQHRPVQVNETIELSCRFGEIDQHDKGIVFDFIATARVSGEIVFEGLMTYLSRQKVTAPPVDKQKSTNAQQPVYQVIEQWQLAENLGRQYAQISGDFNLIHLHALTAKIFGFKQAIAHGLWSKARALAALAPLPNAYQADVWFKLPIFLPSQVEFLTDESSESTSHFMIRNAKTHKPHLMGTLITLN